MNGREAVLLALSVIAVTFAAVCVIEYVRYQRTWREFGEYLGKRDRFDEWLRDHGAGDNGGV